MGVIGVIYQVYSVIWFRVCGVELLKDQESERGSSKLTHGSHSGARGSRPFQGSFVVVLGGLTGLIPYDL